MIGRTNTGGGGVGGVLTVTAPAGVTVSVSKDGKVKTKTANSEGLAIFKGLATGTWQLTITDGVQTSTKPVVITADYSTAIAFFMATISITYPAGSTCTCSDGVTTLTAPDTSGTWACVVPNAGTWTVSCTDGTDSASETVEITVDEQIENVILDYAYWLFKSGTGEIVSLVYGKDLNGTYDVTDDMISVSYTGGSLLGTSVRTETAIDLTEYTTFVVVVNCTKISGSTYGGRFGVSKTAWAVNNNLSHFAAYKHFEANSEKTEYALDISAFSGEYYCGFQGDTIATVYDMYLL